MNQYCLCFLCIWDSSDFDFFYLLYFLCPRSKFENKIHYYHLELFLDSSISLLLKALYNYSHRKRQIGFFQAFLYSYLYVKMISSIYYIAYIWVIGAN